MIALMMRTWSMLVVLVTGGVLSACKHSTTAVLHPAHPSAAVLTPAPVVDAAVPAAVADVELLMAEEAQFLGTADVDDASTLTVSIDYVMSTIPATAARMGATHFVTVATWTHAGQAHTVHLLWRVRPDRWSRLPAPLRPTPSFHSVPDTP
jgi:hypothetical protein